MPSRVVMVNYNSLVFLALIIACFHSTSSRRTILTQCISTPNLRKSARNGWLRGRLELSVSFRQLMKTITVAKIRDELFHLRHFNDYFKEVVRFT